MRELVAALDLGSTSVKASVYSRGGARRSYVRQSVPPLDPATGTFDASAYARSALHALKAAVASCSDPRAVQGIVLAGQRATVLAVNSHGEPVTPAFSWQVPAGDEGLIRIRECLGIEEIRSITGMPALAFLPLVRLSSPGSSLSQATRAGFRLGSLPDFLLCHLGANDLRTDASLASAMGLFDVRERVWHEGLIRMAGVTPELLPEVVAAGSVAGRLRATAASWLGMTSGTPLLVGGGDQQCAALGAGVEPGNTLVNLGTSAAILRPVDHFEKTTPDLITSAHVLSGQWVVERFLGSFGTTLERAARFLEFASVAALEQAAGTAELGPEAPLFVPSRQGGSIIGLLSGLAWDREVRSRDPKAGCLGCRGDRGTVPGARRGGRFRERGRHCASTAHRWRSGAGNAAHPRNRERYATPCPSLRSDRGNPLRSSMLGLRRRAGRRRAGRRASQGPDPARGKRRLPTASGATLLVHRPACLRTIS